MYYDIKHLSWLDLHTLKFSLLKGIFRQITKNFDPSKSGWLNKSIVEACILKLIEVNNIKNEAEDFGRCCQLHL